jgi:hypothetical protein
MNSWTVAAVAIGLTALAGAAVALQNESAEPVSTAAPQPSPEAQPKATPKAREETAPVQARETPMNERVAVLGLLNKRNGIARDLTLKPGQAVRVDNVIVRLRACETTAPWETQKLTGAFVQVDHRGVDNKWRRAFSGWLYKESPSLNVVEHPIYDVWPKSCTMTRPEIGPGTTRVSAPAGGAPARRSSAPKSGSAPAPVATPQASASPSNPT